MAERYDEVIRERYDLDEGVVPESVARSAWKEAVYRISGKFPDDYNKQVYHAGDMVYRELFA